MENRQIVFEAREITRVYRMGEVDVTALRGTNISLFEGVFVVLVGPSGSGKSTLLNILGALDMPTSGQVFLHQQPDAVDMLLEARQSLLEHVPQLTLLNHFNKQPECETFRSMDK